MVGLAVLAVIAGYIAFWWFVYTKARNRGEKIAAIVVALLIPFWDLPFGYFHFQRLCNQDGGLRVSERITPQSAICIDGLGYSPNVLIQDGFQTVEYRNGKGARRHQSRPDGVIESTDVSNLISKYCVSVTYGERFPWNIFRRDLQAIDTSSGKVAARYTTFAWTGSWWKPSGMPGGVAAECFPLKGDELFPLIRSGPIKR